MKRIILKVLIKDVASRSNDLVKQDMITAQVSYENNSHFDAESN